MSNLDDAPDERAAQWWRAVEAEVARRQQPQDAADRPGTGAGPLPDPWAGAAPDVAPLTDEQHELLIRVADQPQVPRLHHLDPLDLAAAEDVDDHAPPAVPVERSSLAAILDRAVDDVIGGAGEAPDPGP